eukprot:s1325_g9.t1
MELDKKNDSHETKEKKDGMKKDAHKKAKGSRFGLAGLAGWLLVFSCLKGAGAEPWPACQTCHELAPTVPMLRVSHVVEIELVAVSAAPFADGVLVQPCHGASNGLAALMELQLHCNMRLLLCH